MADDALRARIAEAVAGAGLIQGTVERIDAYRVDQGGVPLAPISRGVLAMGAMGVAAALATLGIIRLIAAGYGTIAWGFFAVYVIPVLTIGVYQLRAHARANPSSQSPPSTPSNPTTPEAS